MGRLLLAGAVVLTALGTAQAGPTRRVLVESEPPGASVYLEDVDRGVACEPTPCEVNAPIGVVMVIVRLDKYEPEVREVEVPKGKRPLQQKYKLRSAIATIKVDIPKGAAVRVDEEDKGKAPVEIQVSAGDPHHIVVVASGKTVFDDIRELSTGEEYVVKPKLASASAVEDDDATVIDDDEDGEGGGGGGGAGGGSGGGDVTGQSDDRPRSAYVNAGVAFDVGFRRVTYTNSMTDNERELSGGSQAIAGPVIELWPGRMVGVRPLRGLSLFVRAQFSIVPQAVRGNDLMDAVTSKWSSFEGSIRQRWQFGSFAIEASGGYVQDNFAFTAVDSRDLDKMPITSYQSLRIGGRLAYVGEVVEPYLSAENRYVMAGGELANRFDSPTAYGLRGSAGLATRLGPLAARVEGTLMTYKWTFAPDGVNDTWSATAASDTIALISAIVGYSY